MITNRIIQTIAASLLLMVSIAYAATITITGTVTDPNGSAPFSVTVSNDTVIADPVPASRKTDWTFTGVPGGIPNRTTICATLNPGASAATITNAVNACGNGVVFLNAGTYNLAGNSINLANARNVTLRGAGADKTILVGTGTILQMNSGQGTSSGSTITAGGTKGTFTITVSSTANLTVGTMIEVTRNDDPNIIVDGCCASGNITQVNSIVAVNGNVLTMRNPWFYDFTSSVGGVVKWWFPNVRKLVGFENLKLEHNTTTGATNLWYCDSCWFKGVESSHAVGYHFIVLGTLNFEFRDGYVHHGAVGPNNSGINMYGSYQYGGGNSNARIENTIFNQNFPAIELNNSSSGMFIGYNYVYGSNGGGANDVTWSLDDGHSPFNIMNLYEGNVSDMWGADNYFGGTAYATALRNYFTGYNPNFTARGDAVWLDRLAYYYNIIGNVIGSSIQAPVAYAGCDLPAAYRLGMPNLGNCSTTVATPDNFVVPGGYPDAKVTSTLLRWGNYDYFNRATRFVASEIPSGVAVPSSQIIPNSYYYATRPSWWNSGVPWPPIGPDITGGNGDSSGHVNKNPAQLCWETRNLAGAGTFSASACYGD